MNYTNIIKGLFLLLFIATSAYYLLIKSELYESKSALMVRDISTAPTGDSLGLSLLGMGSSSQLQDSMVVEEYLLSLDVFYTLDQQFQLIKHFKSEKLDIIERLSEDATMEEVLEFYRKRLKIVYDESSGILHVAYAHTDPATAKAILEFLIERVEEQINEFNRRKARKQLKFIRSQYVKAKEKMDTSATQLENYQNDHELLDPTTTAASSSAIIANLEAQLTEKKTELSSMRGYLNENNYEIIKIKGEIRSIKRSIKEKKKSLSGTKDQSLNKELFAYERLKMAYEFDIEVYKNLLIQLETAKIDAAKSAKTLSVVSAPNRPDGYTYPDKPKVFVTILSIFLLLYGIVMMLIGIIRDHKE